MRFALRLSALILLALPAAASGAEEASPTRVFDISALLDARADPVVDRLGLGGPSWLLWADERPGVRFLDEFGLDGALTAFLPKDAEVDLREGGRLAVTAPRPALDVAGALLGDLFDLATRRVEVRVDLLTLDAAGAAKLAECGLLAALVRGRLDATQRDAVLAAAAEAGATRVSGATSTRPGLLGRFGRTSTRSYVADFDVEIAQGSVVGDPIVRFATQGVVLHARAFPLAAGDVFLEAVAQTAVLAAPIREVNPEADPIGTIGLPAVRLEQFLTTARLAPGETLTVLRRSRDGRGALAALLLTPRVLGGIRRDAAVRFVPTGVLTAAPLGGRVGWFDGDGAVWSERPGVVEEDVPSAPQFIVDHGTPTADADPARDLAEGGEGRVAPAASGALVADPDAANRLAARVAALEPSATRSLRVRLRVSGGEGAEPSRILDLDLDVPAGRNAFYRFGTERAYLADWDVEVAQEARVGDPSIGHVFGGLLLNLRLDPSPDGKAVAGRVSLVLVDVDPEFEVLRSGNDRTGLIELPRRRQAVLAEDVLLAPGTPAELHGGDAPGFGRLAVTLEVEPR